MGFFKWKADKKKIEPVSITVNDDSSVTNAINTIKTNTELMLKDAKAIIGYEVNDDTAQACQDIVSEAYHDTKQSSNPFTPKTYGFANEDEVVIGIMVYLSAKKLKKN